MQSSCKSNSSPPAKPRRSHVVTPDQVKADANQSNQEYPGAVQAEYDLKGDESGTSSARVDRHEQDTFAYMLDCEVEKPETTYSPFPVLPAPSISFEYTVCSDSEPEVDGICNGLQPYRSPLGPKPSRCIEEPELMKGVIVPLYPGILRNFYGGILNCEPPPHILKKATVGVDVLSSSNANQAALTPAQVTRIERNRQEALARLRARSTQQ